MAKKANTIPKARKPVPPRTSPAWELPKAGFVRQAQLIPAVLPFSGTTLWRKVNDGTFPAPVKLSPRVTAWPVDAVREYLADPVNYRAAPVKPKASDKAAKRTAKPTVRVVR